MAKSAGTTAMDSMKEFLASLYGRLRKAAKDGDLSQSDFDEAVRWARSHTGGMMASRKRAAEIVGTGNFDGVFVGYFLPPDTANSLAVEGGQPADSLHITLSYFGDVASMDDLTLIRTIANVDCWARCQQPLTGTVSGVGRFQADPGDPEAQDVVVALVDVPELEDLQDSLIDCLGPVADEAEDEHGFVPHITLAYVAPGAPLPVEMVPNVPITIDRVTVAAGDRSWEIPLGAGMEMPMASMYGEDGPDARYRLFFEPHGLAEAPDWINYLPTPGTYQHASYGKLVFTPERNSQFVQNFKDGVYQPQIPVDAEHETKLSGAVGWIDDMRQNSDGSVDAHVAWTDRGKALLADDRFKYFSPEYYDQWRDPATEQLYEDVAIGGALTTRPYFKASSLRPLVASEHGIAPPEEGRTHMSEETKNQAPPPEGEPQTPPEAQPAAPATAAPAQMSEDAATKRFAELEAANKVMSEQIARMTAEARTRRFAEEVRGKSDANGTAWVGETEKHVAHLNKLASAFGEDSEEVAHYISLNRAHAEQMRQSALFREMGSNDTVRASSAYAEVEKRAKARQEADPKLSFAEAVAAVATADPQLYAAYRAEKGA